MSSFAPVNDLITLVSTGNGTTALITYTFSTLALGAADANRYIIVCIGGRGGSTRTISSVTIGGVAATGITVGGTVLAEAANAGASGYSAMYAANVPTGTTGDVVVQWNTTMSNCAVFVYRTIVGTGGISSITPTFTNKVLDIAPASNSRTMGSVDLSANSCLLTTIGMNGHGGIYSSDVGTYVSDGKLGTVTHAVSAARRGNVMATTAHKYGYNLSGSAGGSRAMLAAVFAA